MEGKNYRGLSRTDFFFFFSFTDLVFLSLLSHGSLKESKTFFLYFAVHISYPFKKTHNALPKKLWLSFKLFILALSITISIKHVFDIFPIKQVCDLILLTLWHAGVEARGFMFGPSIALSIGAKFVPLRKPRKLPGNSFYFSSIWDVGMVNWFNFFLLTVYRWSNFRSLWFGVWNWLLRNANRCCENWWTCIGYWWFGGHWWNLIGSNQASGYVQVLRYSVFLVLKLFHKNITL